MATAYGYGRVSGRGQAESGVGEDAQKEKNHQTYQRMLAFEGFAWGHHYFDPGVSADRVFFADRPEAKRLLAVLKPGDAVVFFDILRMARRTRDALDVYELLKGKGVRMVVGSMNIDTGNPMVEAMFGMMAVFAQLDTSFIKLRNRARSAALKAGGHWTGGTPPYGYAPVAVGSRQMLCPDFAARLPVKAMCGWLRSGGGAYSVAEVVAHLNATGHRRPAHCMTRAERKAGVKAAGLWTEKAVYNQVRYERTLQRLERENGVDNQQTFLLPGRGVVEYAKLPIELRHFLGERSRQMAGKVETAVAAAPSS